MTFASFTDLSGAVSAKINADDRESALALLSGSERVVPLHAGHIYLWRAALLAELARADAALDALDEALAAGCRYRVEWLRDDRRLASLKGNTRFAQIVEHAASRYEQDQANARPALQVVMPRTSRPESGFPALIALHGNHSNVAQTLPFWTSATDLGWLVALPQSGEIGMSPHSYTWNDRDRTLAELEQHRRALSEQHLIDEREVVLAGFSMGGLQALALVLTRRFNVRCVISVAAYLPHIREFRVLIESGNAAGARFYIVVGREDASGYDGAKQLVTELERAGVEARLDERPDLGHAYPSDMRETLRRALTFMRSPARVAPR